jgi:hypothetical protein
MTPLQKIESGIVDGNMFLVAEGYSDLTGDKIEVRDTMTTSDNSAFKQILSVINDYNGGKLIQLTIGSAPGNQDTEGIKPPAKRGRPPKNKAITAVALNETASNANSGIVVAQDQPAPVANNDKPKTVGDVLDKLDFKGVSSTEPRPPPRYPKTQCNICEQMFENKYSSASCPSCLQGRGKRS